MEMTSMDATPLQPGHGLAGGSTLPVLPITIGADQAVAHSAWTAAREAALAALLSGPSVVVVAGPPGTGKTLMLEDLALALDRSGAATLLHRRGDLGSLAGPGPAGAGAQPDGFERPGGLEWPQDPEMPGRGLAPDVLPAFRVRLIDEADRLDDAALAALAADPRSGLVLARKDVPATGEPDPVAEAVAGGRGVTTVRLAALQPGEAGTFLRTRLAAAGQSADLVTDEAVAAIEAYSGGVPRLINMLASAAFFLAATEGAAEVAADHVAEAAELRGLAPFAEPEAPEAESPPTGLAETEGPGSGPIEGEPVEVGPIEVGPIETGPIEIGPIEAQTVEPGTPDARTPEAGHSLAGHSLAGPPGARLDEPQPELPRLPQPVPAFARPPAPAAADFAVILPEPPWQPPARAVPAAESVVASSPDVERASVPVADVTRVPMARSSAASRRREANRTLVRRAAVLALITAAGTAVTGEWFITREPSLAPSQSLALSQPLAPAQPLVPPQSPAASQSLAASQSTDQVHPAIQAQSTGQTQSAGPAQSTRLTQPGGPVRSGEPDRPRAAALPAVAMPAVSLPAATMPTATMPATTPQPAPARLAAVPTPLPSPLPSPVAVPEPQVLASLGTQASAPAAIQPNAAPLAAIPLSPAALPTPPAPAQPPPSLAVSRTRPVLRTPAKARTPEADALRLSPQETTLPTRPSILEGNVPARAPADPAEADRPLTSPSQTASSSSALSDVLRRYAPTNAERAAPRPLDPDIAPRHNPTMLGGFPPPVAEMTPPPYEQRFAPPPRRFVGSYVMGPDGRRTFVMDP